MGLPFASGHYLALRDFPAASFLPDSVPGYRSVWHRDPDGRVDVLRDHARRTELRPLLQLGHHQRRRRVSGRRHLDRRTTRLVVDIPDVLHWTIELQPHGVDPAADPDRLPATRRCLDQPRCARRDRPVRRVPAGCRAGATGGHDAQRSELPHRATADVGRDAHRGPCCTVTTSAPVAPLPDQARLGDFRAPQRGLAVVGQGRFDAFDPTRHRTATDLACPPSL